MINMTETITKIINPAYKTILNIDKSKSGDELISDLSDDAKTCLIKLGLKWPEMVGPNGSYVNYDLLQKVLMIPDLWTLNKLKKYSNCGYAGINNSLVPYFYNVGIIESYKNSHTQYIITETGREVINMLYINCNSCNNTRKCIKCNDGYQFGLCGHIERHECAECNGTGKFKCMQCEIKEETQDNENDQNCYNCDGNKTTKCYWCTEKCDKCNDDKRLKCWSCNGDETCTCVQRLKLLDLECELYEN